MLRLGLLFFLSGFAALVYQLLWLRHLGLVLGNTVAATATVLTAFMAGLALGARVFGRHAPRFRRPVAVFGALEAGIGVWAALMPLMFLGIRHAYRAAYGLTESGLVLTPLRFALALLVMLVPTMLMGGSLPVLAQGLIRSDERFATRLGWLYGLNTLGAVAGLLVSGFVLLPRLGLSIANGIAVAVNLGVGGFAWLLARRGAGAGSPSPGEEGAPGAAEGSPGERGGGLSAGADGGVSDEAGSAAPVEAAPALSAEALRTARLALAATAASGFLALSLEVAWFRTLLLVFGSTTYSFAAMLAVFLTGIGLGSLLLGRLGDRVARPLVLLAAAQVVVGAWTLWSIARFDDKPGFYLEWLLARGFTWPQMLAAKFLVTLDFLLVPTLMFGLSFPLAARALRRAVPLASRTVGDTYTANTAGAVLGSLCAGFLLLPHLGIESSLLVLAVGAGLVGLVLALAAGGRRPVPLVTAAAGLVVLLVAAFAPPSIDRRLLSHGAHFAPLRFVEDGRIVLWERMETWRPVVVEEGATAIVAATRSDDETLIYSSGGKIEADTSPRSMMLQRMAGHLPALFHPAPRKVINVGLGAGVTLGALALHGAESVEVVEIEPEALRVAEAFSAYNHDVLSRPSVEVIVGDGRNHLFATRELYDVITSDPFEPVMAGANALYTLEHFEQVKRRLAPGGIACQYVPLYELDREDWLAIARSFVAAFPESALFFTGDDTLFLGFRDELRLDADVLRESFRSPEVRASLREIGLSEPEDVLAMFVADLSRHPELLPEGPLNTDDRPIVEYSAPKSVLVSTIVPNRELLSRLVTPLPAGFREGLSERQLARLEGDREALQLTLRAEALLEQGQTEEALSLLTRAHELAPEHPVIVNELSEVLLDFGLRFLEGRELEKAERQLLAVLRIDDRSFWAWLHVSQLALARGDVRLARRRLEAALERFPGSPLMLTLRSRARLAGGDARGAVADARAAISEAPGKPEAWRALEDAAAAAGDAESAREAAERAAELEARRGRPR